MDSKSKKSEKTYKIFLVLTITLFIIGVVLLLSSKTKVEYPISEYWVAKDYHHVYEKYSGSIVDVISDNETCKMRGEYIIVTTTNKGLNVAGGIIAGIFGTILAVIIAEELKYR